ncbi:MAG: GGDEF domain-containing protein [Bacillota bacterium]|nr:GGDEF domain-containing protein [Bacillota bacterium]
MKIPLERILDHLPAGVLFADPENTIVYCNAAERQLRGGSGRPLIGHSVLECHPEPVREKVEALIRSFKERQNSGMVLMNERHAKFIEQWLIPVYDGDRTFLGTMLVSVDVTARESSRRQVELKAIRDELTGLFNRNHFFAVFDSYAGQLGQQLPSLVLIMADVNGLKALNDRLGREAGDRLLVRAAEVVQSAVRTLDPVFRVGDDEFVALLPGGDEKAAAATFRRIKTACRRFSEVHPELPLSLAVGWSVARSPEGAAAMFSLADKAMYQDKQREKGQLTSPR